MPWKCTSPRALQHVENQIALADRAAAREHDDVVRRARRRARRESSSIESAGDRQRDGDAAVPADDRLEREAVDVVDLSRRRAAGPARRSRCRSRGSRPSAARTRRPSSTPVAASAPMRLGFSTWPARDDRLAGRDVRAAAPDVLPRIDRREHADAVVAVALGLFDHHDRVGARRHRRAGRDLDALARRRSRAPAPGP